MRTDWVDGYLAAWDSHDGKQVAAFVADEVVYDDLASGEIYQGRDSIPEYVERTHDFSTDYRFVTVSSQADGDAYTIEWEMLGTNTGASGGYPATGKPYRIRGASIGTLDADGKIASNRDYWNVAAYLVEVGLMPPFEG